jgi:hypothetical protein
VAKKKEISIQVKCMTKNPYIWDPKFVSSESCSHVTLKLILGMIYFMAATQHLPGGTDTNQSEYPAAWPRLKLGTFQ